MVEPKDYVIPIKGYELIEKDVAKSGNSGYLYLPARWVDKRVAIILLDDPTKEKKLDENVPERTDP